MIVVLRRVGDVCRELERAKDAIERELGLEVIVEPWRKQPDLRAFDWERGQYLASALLESLGGVEGALTLYLVNADAYERGLNFVFGLAMPGLGVGAVFLPRLRNEFYGWEPNEELYMERVEKEVLHELGHLLGLEHCPNPRCVMSFSNSIYDVDRKEARFCERCKAELRKRLSA